MFLYLYSFVLRFVSCIFFNCISCFCLFVVLWSLTFCVSFVMVGFSLVALFCPYIVFDITSDCFKLMFTCMYKLP